MPGRVRAGRGFELHLRAEDAWGNPAVLDSPVRLGRWSVATAGVAPASPLGGIPSDEVAAGGFPAGEFPVDGFPAGGVALPPAGWCRSGTDEYEGEHNGAIAHGPSHEPGSDGD